MHEFLSHNDLKNLLFITGGARCGKSAFAESQITQFGGSVVYLATMQLANDDLELAQRIAEHRKRRPSHWTTVEEPLLLVEVIRKLAEKTKSCLVDCLSLWISNLLLTYDLSTNDRSRIELEICIKVSELLNEIASCPKTNFLIVTNEVGSGVVPENDLARLYRDLLGSANQQVAKAASRAWLSCAGLTIKLK